MAEPRALGTLAIDVRDGPKRIGYAVLLPVFGDEKRWLAVYIGEEDDDHTIGWFRTSDQAARALAAREETEGTTAEAWASLDDFYMADRRRERSGEMDFGVHWTDGRGARFRVSAIQDTGEIYALRLGPGLRDASVELLASGLPTGPDCYEEAEMLLDGWADEYTNELAWARERLGVRDG